MRMVSLINPALARVEDLLSASCDLTLERAQSVEGFGNSLAGADAALISNSTYDSTVAGMLRASADLRWIQTTSVGTDRILAFPPRPDVTVTNAAGLKSRVVAEHAMALLLGLTRRIVAADRSRRDRTWATKDLAPQVDTLEGRTLLLIGYGSIGREIARKAAAFDMRVIAVNRSGIAPPPAHKAIARGKLDEALPAADVVILCMPLTDDTRGIFGRDQFARMKPSALFVNVGRGELVDEASLADALRDGRIRGAGLDVFAKEPLPPSDSLWDLPNTIITPHLGGHGGDDIGQLCGLVEANARRFAAGQVLLNLVEFA